MSHFVFEHAADLFSGFGQKFETVLLAWLKMNEGYTANALVWLNRHVSVAKLQLFSMCFYTGHCCLQDTKKEKKDCIQVKHRMHYAVFYLETLENCVRVCTDFIP
jgi:hypothetical protein